MYDTVYAFQDRKDDLNIKVKGLALRWGTRTKQYAKRANLAMLASLLTGGYMFDLSFLFYAGSIVHYFIYNLWIDSVKYKKHQTFHQFFMKNSMTGLVIFLLILVGRIGADSRLQTETKEKTQTEGLETDQKTITLGQKG